MAHGVRTPRVTVVIPAHNSERFLPEALESVLAQTYSDWEAVVADDASTDATYEVASRFASSHPGRIHTIRLDRNSGPAVARNAAIAASAGGELIALLDADDRWVPHYLDSQVDLYDRAVAEGRRPGIVACNAYVQREDDDHAGTLDLVQGWVDPVTYDDMIERSYIFVSAIFPRAAYLEVGGFSAECWGSEDYDLWLRIMEAGYDVVSTREPLAVYRQPSNSVSRNELGMADAALAAYTRALARNAQSPRQRRAVKARIRHYRALRERALVRQALAADGRPGLTRHLPHAAMRGTIAVLQAPSRWAEWSRELLSRRQRG